MRGLLRSEMYLVRKALEEYKEFITRTPFEDRLIVYPLDSSPEPTTFKFRCDFEFYRDSFEGLEEFFRTGLLSSKEISNMFDQMEFDLEDFIIFANSNEMVPGFVDFQYPFDGVIKRRAMPDDIKLRAAKTYREYKTMKDAVELTTLVRLDVKWES
jgi:hypothetical protein